METTKTTYVKVSINQTQIVINRLTARAKMFSKVDGSMLAESKSISYTWISNKGVPDQREERLKDLKNKAVMYFLTKIDANRELKKALSDVQWDVQLTEIEYIDCGKIEHLS